MHHDLGNTASSRFAMISLGWGCHGRIGVEWPWEPGFPVTHVGRVALAR